MPIQHDLNRRFLQLAAINVLSNLMVPLANLIDIAFLGHLTEIRHLAGVALAGILFSYIYWTFGFLRMATTGTTAQAAGRADWDGVLLTGLRYGAIALLISIVILVLQQPLRELGFFLLSATAEVKEAGRDYYNATILGAPATLLNLVLIGWFLGREQAAKVLLLSVVDKGADIPLNYLFIVRWGWGSAGAGWSTAIGQYLTLLVGLALVYRELPPAKIRSLWHKIFERSALTLALSLNRDILIRTLVLVTAFATFTNLSSALGTTVLAANTLLMQVVSLTAYFIDGLAFATESIAGSLRGRGEKQALVSLIKLSGGSSLGIGLLFALIFLLVPEPLFELLTDHTEVIAQIRNYVFWLLPVLGFGAIAFMLDGYFLGLTEGPVLRNSSLAATLLGYAPIALAAWWFKSSHLLWLALSLFMVARALTLGIQVPKTLK